MTHLLAFLRLGLTGLLFAQAAELRAADAFLVENGQPRAEIVIAQKPQRSVRVAAQDLQTYLEKISGAKLPIVTEPSGDGVAKLFLGKS